jgi:hypothetical protein
VGDVEWVLVRLYRVLVPLFIYIYLSQTQLHFIQNELPLSHPQKTHDEIPKNAFHKHRLGNAAACAGENGGQAWRPEQRDRAATGAKRESPLPDLQNDEC